jgi:cytochrome c-type biogenesis protein CcmH
MTGWFFAIALALVCFIALAVVLKVPRKGWEAVGAALILGLAGYALQGSPAQPGAPKAPAEQAGKQDVAAEVDARRKLGNGAMPSDKLLFTADAFARHGQYADAAELLRTAVRKDPNNGDAWLAMANALVQHAEGNLSPAAIYAFQRANQAAPDHPGPPFFLGLALAQSGRLSEGRAMWADLLARTPKDAPWHDELVAKLAELDAFIARHQSAGPLR